MVCDRCKLVVAQVCKDLDIAIHYIELGEIETVHTPASDQLKILDHQLKLFGFERIASKKGQVIEKIKLLIVGLVYNQSGRLKQNLSAYLSDQLHQEYSGLSTLFSEVEGITIEKYFILQKIERIKELLMYDELSLSEIADQMGYSSVAYLSNQFKKSTGFTPSYFKSLKDKKRRQIDAIR
jgi:AraC-like DNA-binding protein